MAWRQRRNDAFYGWYRILDSNNYTTYTVTKTGDGASGKWGISVSGNAATATKLATPKTIALSGDVTATGVSFDGSANITLNTAMNVNYAGSASKGGAALTVKDWGVGDSDSARHVWFSYAGDDTKKVYNDKFRYNPATDKLTVGSITGSSASCTGNAATATKLAASKTISLSGDVKGSVSFDGSANVTIASTLTANYAGSSSKGGAATSANKLNTNAGSTTLPVYFADGIPKAINKTNVGISITGNAATASKLASAKTISISGITTGSATFDGSANVTITTTFNSYGISGGNTNNYPFRRFASASIGTDQWQDYNLILRLTQTYQNGFTGVCKIAVRTNGTGSAVGAEAHWIEASYMKVPKIYVGILGKTGENVVADFYYKCPVNYPRTKIEIISSKTGNNWTFYNSNEANDTTTTDKLKSTECYASVEEGGTTIRKSAYTSITESSIANCASLLSAGCGGSNAPVYINSSGVPTAISYQINKTVPSNAVFTDTTYSSGNGITIDGNRKINHSNTITAKTAYGSTATAASANGGSITVTDVKYDAYGHITGSTDRTIKLSQTVYSLPTAGSTLGGVKTTSTVTSASGYTACPIISGVPYYKDTNTTYTLAGLMGSSAKGSATQPVYWTGSAWANTTYTLGKSVPSDAKFTDTVYSLPTASSTLGGVKTTSKVTDASGYTACPIIGGVPYYKDTNTTYNLSSFGITASAAELNYCKGVTSAIQTQLNGKVPTSRTVNGKALSSNISLSYGDVGAAAANHSHSYLPISGGTVTGVVSITNTTASSSTSTGALKVSGGIGCAGNIYGANVYGAVWNDYAEFRISDCLEPGRVVCENGNDTLSISTKRLQPGANVISDTYGFSIGETDEAKCPIAVSGRVLAYGYEDRELFRKNIGHPVCAGPNGTVSIMTDEEYKNYGYCAIGTISAVPDYEEWGTGKVKVNNRIWIKI